MFIEYSYNEDDTRKKVSEILNSENIIIIMFFFIIHPTGFLLAFNKHLLSSRHINLTLAVKSY